MYSPLPPTHANQRGTRKRGTPRHTRNVSSVHGLRDSTHSLLGESLIAQWLLSDSLSVPLPPRALRRRGGRQRRRLLPHHNTRYTKHLSRPWTCWGRKSGMCSHRTPRLISDMYKLKRTFSINRLAVASSCCAAWCLASSSSSRCCACRAVQRVTVQKDKLLMIVQVS